MSTYQVIVQYPYTSYCQQVLQVEADTPEAAAQQAIALADEEWGHAEEIGGDAGESEAFSVKSVLPDGSVGDELLPAPAPSPADLCFRYAARLNELEIAPNGDDFNALLALLAGGAYTEPRVTGR